MTSEYPQPPYNPNSNPAVASAPPVPNQSYPQQHQPQGPPIVQQPYYPPPPPIMDQPPRYMAPPYPNQAYQPSPPYPPAGSNLGGYPPQSPFYPSSAYYPPPQRQQPNNTTTVIVDRATYVQVRTFEFMKWSL